MKNMLRSVPITRTLLVFYVLLFLVLGIVRYVEYRKINRASEQLHQLTTTSAERQYLLTNILNNNNYIRVDELWFLYSAAEEEMPVTQQRILHMAEQNRQLRKQYRFLVADTIEQARYDSVVNSFRGIWNIRADIFALANAGQIGAARAQDRQRMQPAYQHFRELNFQLADYVVARDKQSTARLKSELLGVVDLTRNLTAVVGILLTILGVIIIITIKTVIRKKDELADSEYKYRMLIQRTNELIVAFAPDGRVLMSNTKFRELLGYTEEDAAEVNVMDLMTPEAAEISRQSLMDPEDDAVIPMVFREITGKNGKKMYIEGNVIREYKNGKFIKATGFFNDVTDRVHLKHALEYSEQNFRQLFNLAPIPMYTFDPHNFRFLQVNDTAVDHYGFSKQEFLNKTLFDIRPESEYARTRAAIEPIVGQNQTYQASYTHLKRDGTPIDVEIFASRILLNDRPVIMASIVDVTERKIFENRVTQAIIKTQEEERYEIGAELHDNVCQLLASAKMSMGLMRTHLPEQSKSCYSQSIESITMASEEIRNLSHRLAPVFFKNTNLKESFTRLLNTFNIGEHYETEMYFDPALEERHLSKDLQLNLYRILQEQLRNITKYAKASKIKLDILLHKSSLHMLISDDGIGFDVEKTPTGIGLANMKRRVDFFHGRMQLFTAPGEGCEILIAIPLSC